MMYYSIVSVFVWCPYIAINVRRVQDNGKLLPDIIMLLTQRYYRTVGE